MFFFFSDILKLLVKTIQSVDLTFFLFHAAFFFKLVSFFCFVFWHYFKSIAKDFQSLAINLASGQCGSGFLLEVNCIPLNCTNVLMSSWKTNFHHPLTHSYPRLLKRKHFLVIQYFKSMWKFKQKEKKIMSTLSQTLLFSNFYPRLLLKTRHFFGEHFIILQIWELFNDIMHEK